MIFCHNSDKAVSKRAKRKDRDRMIQLWEHIGSDFSWKARETNCFHSPQWVLSPVCGPECKEILHLLLSHTPSFPLLSLCLHFTHWVINASVVALTRLLFYQRESEVAAFHGHLDTFHKSCKAEVNCKDKILCLKCAGARRHSMVGNNIFPVGCINLPVECNLYIYTSLYLYYLNG